MNAIIMGHTIQTARLLGLEGKMISKRLSFTRSAKIGCRSRITVSCYQNKLRIVRFNLKHNHDVAPEHAKAYPRNRRLTPTQLSVVEKMIQSNCDVHTIRDFIASKLIIIFY